MTKRLRHSGKSNKYSRGFNLNLTSGLSIQGKYASGFYGQTVTSWRHKPIGPPVYK